MRHVSLNTSPISDQQSIEALLPAGESDGLVVGSLGLGISNSTFTTRKSLRCPRMNKLLTRLIRTQHRYITTWELRRELTGWCKNWDCEVCGPMKVGNLQRRLWTSEMFEEAKRLEALGNRYAVKFLTLTLPGGSRRREHTPAEWSVILKDEYKRLNDAMNLKAKRAGYPRWAYFVWVIEDHKDGYPHFHVLVVGEYVSRKEILPELEALWTHRYGMGNVDVAWKIWDKRAKRWRARSVEESFGYMVKYMGKGLSGHVEGSNRYGASRGGLGKLEAALVKPDTLTGFFDQVDVSDLGELQLGRLFQCTSESEARERYREITGRAWDESWVKVPGRLTRRQKEKLKEIEKGESDEGLA